MIRRKGYRSEYEWAEYVLSIRNAPNGFRRPSKSEIAYAEYLLDNKKVMSNTSSEKSRTAALLLCFFLGAFGAHRFYVRKYGTAILWLFTFGLLGFGTLVDFILIITGSFKDKHGLPLKNWA